ncbi:MAG: DUF4838 domain-containing protein [Armatimonadota bacterium]|nr:DUF4838 domain-containing protein [Armatimonadota bacterium]
MTRHLLIVSVIAVSAVTAWCQEIALVEDGASEFVIYHAPDAPASVVDGATDLQRYAERATGATLPIVTEPAEPMICLGDNASARAAGLSVDEIPVEGFRILTTGGSIYIAGPDTAEGEHTAQGGTSRGTRNGVCTFLERFLGVRFLMPGEQGDYVPHSDSVTIPETDMQDAPFFLNRRVPYTQQRRPPVIEWWARQKLGWSLYLSHGHNFRRTIPAELYQEHPDYFPMFDGRRVPPTGRYKLCLTNPGLIEAFAQRIIDHFDAHPDSTSYSLSPSDSAGWCQCPDCTALYEEDPNGELSVTPAVLHFYNGVARIVAEEYPQKVLAGYVYAQYVYPPKEPIELERELQPNIFLVWAPSFDYGYTLFRPELRETWEALLEQWTQVTDNIAYYDLPTSMANDAGAPCPPGLEILQFIYPRLKGADIKGVYVYGQAAWGTGAPTNYLLAKLAWDPDTDVEATFEEFINRCYGAGSDEIEEMYRLLDAEVKRHFLENEDARYRLTPKIMEDVYARNFAEMERLYRGAEAKVTDPDAQARLQWLGWNLTLLHWNLRQFDMLDEPQASSFYMSDADFFEWFAERKQSLAFRQPRRGASPADITPVEATPVDEVPVAEEVQPFLLRGSQHIVVAPTADEARIGFSRITTRGKLVQYTLHDAEGEEVAAGLMSDEVPITLDAGGSPFYHVLISAGPASFMLEVEGGAWAVSGEMDEKGLHLLNHVTPIYFEVPEGVESFTLSVAATPPGETALASLYAPDGRGAATFRVVEVPIDRQQIAVGAGDAGVWKLVISEAETGVVDDVWIDLGDEIPNWFSLDPERALSVRPAK